jgi:hypothetical protein
MLLRLAEQALNLLQRLTSSTKKEHWNLKELTKPTTTKAMRTLFDILSIVLFCKPMESKSKEKINKHMRIASTVYPDGTRLNWINYEL